MMRFHRMAAVAAAVVTAAMMWGIPAQAQATRTWISGVGDDVNPCSRTAPCKTYAGAISKTAAGGEIDALDPGGFGTVTITKSITLDGGGGEGGQVGSILASGTNGITINCSSCNVKIRNMTINGIAGSGSAGLSGIKLFNGAALIVEHVGIFGFGGTSGSNGGIDFEPSTAAKLEVVDSEIQYGLGDGVLIKPTTGGSVTATLDHASLLSNVGSGIRVDSTGLTSGNGSNVTIFNSNMSGNGTGVSALSPAGTVVAQATVTGSVIAGNSVFGVLASGANATVRVGGSTISGNGTGVIAGGGSAVKSFGDNYVGGNTSNGTPTAPDLTKF